MNPEEALALRMPFPPEKIGKLPRAGIQLDYVGHADVTDRLLTVDPDWSWEPFATDEDGLPKVIYGDRDAVLWIKLTVCGMTRPGVGIVSAKAFELEKQLISDALRNAAMRFGVALDLWRKDDHVAEDDKPVSRPRHGKRQSAAKCEGCGKSDGSFVKKSGQFWHAECWTRDAELPDPERPFVEGEK